MTIMNESNTGPIESGHGSKQIEGRSSNQVYSVGLLPLNWEIGYSENGEKYFIDHNTGTTHWDDPRLDKRQSPTTTVSSTNQPVLLLPEGWERVDDPDHGTFYVDHINRHTQYERPTLQTMPTHMDYPIGKQHSNNLLLEAKGFKHFKKQSPMTHGVKEKPENVLVPSKQCRSAQNRPQHFQNSANLNLSTDSDKPFDNAGNDELLDNRRSQAVDPSAKLQYQHIRVTSPAYFVFRRPSSLQNAVPASLTENNGVGANAFAGCCQHHHRQNILPPSLIFPRSVGQMQNSSALSFFTTDPSKLQGEFIQTKIPKGVKGLGFTLIGNDGTNLEPELIQIKNVIPNGPAATNGTLFPGDILVSVNSQSMLGVSQDDACQIFRQIPVGQLVDVRVCRGYPLQLDPTNRIFTENVYSSTGFAHINASSKPAHLRLPTQARSDLRKQIIPVKIFKGPRGFGFTITDSIQGQQVKTVLYADQCPNLLEGDVIVQVCGKDVRAWPHTDLVKMFHECQIGYRSTMLVLRYNQKHRSRTPTANFRYGMSQPVIPPGVVNTHNKFFPADQFISSRSRTPVPVRPTERNNASQCQHHPFDCAHNSIAPNTACRNMTSLPWRTHTLPRSSCQSGRSANPNIKLYTPSMTLRHSFCQQHQNFASTDVDLSSGWNGHTANSVQCYHLPLSNSNDSSFEFTQSKQLPPLKQQNQHTHQKNKLQSFPTQNQRPSGLRHSASLFIAGDDSDLQSQTRQHRTDFWQHLATTKPTAINSNKYVPVLPPAAFPPPPPRQQQQKQQQKMLKSDPSSSCSIHRTHNIENNNDDDDNTRTGDAGTSDDSCSSSAMRIVINLFKNKELPRKNSTVFETSDALDPAGGGSFGFRLLGGREIGIPLSVGEILPNGAAALDGRLQMGDQIIEINDVSVSEATHDEAVAITQRTVESSTGHVKLVVLRPSPISHKLTQPTQSIITANHNIHLRNCVPYDVQLDKVEDEDFGCTIMSHNNRYISEILPNSPADRSGKLNIGDCVIAINGRSTLIMNHMEISTIIRSSGNRIIFTIDPTNKLLPKTYTVSDNEQQQQINLRDHNTSSLMYGLAADKRPKNELESVCSREFDELMEEGFIPVELKRGPRGFGFSIRGGWEFEQMPLFVLKVADDGPAAESSAFRIGDQLLEIDGKSTERMTHEEAIQMIKDRQSIKLLLFRRKKSGNFI